MWRVADQEDAKDARLREIQRRNERLATNVTPIDYAERVRRAMRHCGVRAGDHRHFELPPREIYFKDMGGWTVRQEIDLRGLPVTGEWISAIVTDVQGALTNRKHRGMATTIAAPTRLCLAETPVTDAAFVSVQRLKQLREIDVSRCSSLMDDSLTLIRRVFSGTLEILDVSECRHFTGDTLCQLWRDCARLHTLVAHGCPGVTDAFLHCVATTKRQGNSLGLYSLDIRHCKNVTSSGISHVATSTLKTMEIASLIMGDCLEVDNMAFFGFESSVCLANIVILSLAGLRVDETGLSWIAKGCKQLEVLDLSRCRFVNDFSLLLLSPLLSGRLRKLSLLECVLISDQGLKNLFSIEVEKHAKSNKKDSDDEDPESVALERINLEGCHLVGDDTLRLFGQYCGKLTKLNLRGLRKVSDAGVLAVAKGCSRLSAIKISGRHITDQTFKVLGKISPRLTRLDISERLDLQTPECVLSLTSGVRPERLTKLNFAATNICDVGVSVIATCCRCLLWINLSKCAKVGDVAIEALAYCCTELQVLLLANTKAITDRSLFVCAMMRLPLHTLDISGNTNFTDAGIAALATTCQSIRELRLKGCDRLSFATVKQASYHLPFTCTPLPPSLSQKLATGGGNVNMMLKPLTGRHIELIKALVAQFEGACVLQAQYRRWKQKEESALFLARRKHQRQARAARMIQKCIRRFLSWRRYLRHLRLEKNSGVVKYVQAHVRGNQSRHQTRVLKFTKSRAATLIQRAYRRHFNIRMPVRHARALTIQRVFRGHRGRQAYGQVVLERKFTSAKRIWVWYRKCLHQQQARARARWLVRKIHNIQGQWRRYKRRQHLTRYLAHYRRHATKIQKIWRGFSTRRRVTRLRIEWAAAASRIQSVYRSHRIRCIVHVYRAQANQQATVVQKYWRRYAERKHYKHHRGLVIQMQRMARYVLIVRNFRRVVHAAVAKHRNAAALSIQRVLRGHFGRRRALLFRKIRNATYAKKGQNASQAWIRQGFIRSGAAIRLQRFIRRYQARRKMLKLHKWRRFVAARCLQRYLKDWMRRLRLKRKREAQTHAAMAVQRVYRGHLGRVAFKAEKHCQDCLRSARLVQRVYRGYKGRCFYKQLRCEMVGAARMLQRAYRGRNTRKLFEISQATAALKAKEKYEKSILGMIDAKRNPMDELYRRAKLPHEKDILQKLHDKWEANRTSQERAVRKLTKEIATQVWPSTEETIANHLGVRSRLYGVTENVYVSHREHVERQERQVQLKSDLVHLHTRIWQCKQALREAVASRRMLDGKEIMEIMRTYGLADEEPVARSNQLE